LAQTVIASPFVEQLPIAGTLEHRVMAKHILFQLFSKKQDPFVAQE
jgi:hypothetical protein